MHVLAVEPVDEALAPIVAFFQTMALDHGAHRAIDDEDALGQGVMQLADAIGV